MIASFQVYPQLTDWNDSVQLLTLLFYGGSIYLDLRFGLLKIRQIGFKIFRGLAPLSRYIKKNSFEQ